ncbi:hypothetical protein Bbelb_034190 [Branchiostoma belcheri]|nr:hypothetical protein Bbelb_034190 [Branchiostoma belcheri]
MSTIIPSPRASPVTQWIRPHLSNAVPDPGGDSYDYVADDVVPRTHLTLCKRAVLPRSCQRRYLQLGLLVGVYSKSGECFVCGVATVTVIFKLPWIVCLKKDIRAAF